MKKIYAYIMALFLLLYSECWPAFYETGVSPRAIAMSNAFMCSKDTALSIYYNPAGLAGMAFSEVSIGYGKRLLGLSDMSDISNSFIAGAFSIKGVGTVGVGWQNLGLSGNYQEHVFLLSYGYNLMDNLSAGITGKQFYRQFGRDAYTDTDPVFTNTGYTKLSLGVDVGLIYKVETLPIRVGFAALDINAPDIGIGAVETLPLTLKFGAAFVSEDLFVEVDAVFKNSRIYFNAGGEGWIFQKDIIIRSGFSMGDTGLKEATFGLGYKTNEFDFNYSFSFPMSGVANTFGSHQTSISFRFGDLPKTKEEMKFADVAKELEETKIRLSEIEKATAEEIAVLAEKVKSQETEIGDYKKKEDIVKSVATEINKKMDSGDTKVKAQALASAIYQASVAKKNETQTYIVQKGDNMKTVAEKFYKDGKKWELIYKANKDKIKGGVLTPGMELILPPDITTK